MTTINSTMQSTSGAAVNECAAAPQAGAENAAWSGSLVQNSLHSAVKAFADAASGASAVFGRGNLEAVAQSTQAYLIGMHDFGRQYVAAMQDLTRRTLEDAKGFTGVKSLKDAMALQANLTWASTDRALDQGMKLQQAALTLIEQVHAPMTRRANAALKHTTLAHAA